MVAAENDQDGRSSLQAPELVSRCRVSDRRFQRQKHLRGIRQDDRRKNASPGSAADEHANFSLDPEGRVRTWNHHAEALTGWSEDEILDEHVSTLYVDGLADEAGLDQALENARIDGHFENEGWCERPSGTEFPASTTITPLPTDDGGVSGYTVVLRDEADRRRVESERCLLAAVSRTVAAAESFTDGVRKTLAAVTNHTQWAYGEAWAPATDSEHLEYIVGHAEDEALEKFSDASESVTFPFGEGLPGRVYASGTAEWIPNASEESKTGFHRADLAADVDLRAALGVPIRTDDRVVAVLTFFLREHRTADQRLVGVVGDVAADLGGLIARKQSEDALAAERALLDQVFKTAPVGLLVTDTDGTITRANRHASDIFGAGNGSLVGGAYEDVDVELRTPDGDVLSVDQLQVARSLEQEEAVADVELQLVGDGSEPTWVSVSTAPIRTADGAVEGVTVVVEDITERRRAQKALEKSERKFRAVFEETFDALLIANDETEYVDVNPAAAELFGLPEEELLGRSIVEFAPEDYDVEKAWREFQESDEARGRFPLLRADGERRTVEFVANPDILPGRHLSAIRDVTDRKERERQLRTFRKAVEASGHSIYYTDSDGTIEYVNPMFEETTGYTAEEAIGRTPRLLKSGEHDQELYEELWDTILAGDTWRGELVNTTKKGDRYVVEQTISPVVDESGEIKQFVAVSTDITERKDRERRYDAIFNQTYQFTGLLDRDGTLVEANETALEFGGMARAAVVGKKLWNTEWFQHGDAAERAREAVERARDGEFVRQQLEIQGADRAAVIDFSIRPVTDDHGEITFLIPEGRDITDRVEAERKLENHRERLATVNHLYTIVHEITDAVIEQSSREDIERTVCEAVVDVDSYEFAWVGDIDTKSETANVRTEAGVKGNFDGRTIPVDAENEQYTGPAMSAFRTRTVQVGNGDDTGTGHEPWHDRVDAHDGRSVATIPLVHDDTIYGVLTVYTDRPHAFESHEQAVLGQLGEIVGQAVAAAERKQALVSDEIVELEFYVLNFLDSIGIDTTADGRINLDQVVSTGDGDYLVYGTMTPDARETLDALIEQYEHWDSVTVISEGEDSSRFQVRVTDLPLRSTVASKGGSIEESQLEDGDLHLRLHLSPNVDVNAITEVVHDTYPTAQFLAKRQFTRPRDSVSQLRQSIFEQLTDRQREILEVAYYQGYFEWPRNASGNDLADSLGIAPATFSQHLRRAEKTVFESIFSPTAPAEQLPR